MSTKVLFYAGSDNATRRLINFYLFKCSVTVVDFDPIFSTPTPAEIMSHFTEAELMDIALKDPVIFNGLSTKGYLDRTTERIKDIIANTDKPMSSDYFNNVVLYALSDFIDDVYSWTNYDPEDMLYSDLIPVDLDIFKKLAPAVDPEIYKSQKKTYTLEDY